MRQHAETSVFFLIRPISLAASFAFAILLFCCRGDNAFMLYFDLYNVLDELIAAFGVGAIAGSVAIALAPTESKRARRVWTVLSALCCIAAVLCALASDPESTSRAALACGSLLGFGTIGLTAQWCCVFARLPRRAIPFTIALSFFFGSCLWFIMQIVGGFVPVCIALIVFSLCCGLLLLVAIGPHGAASRDSGDSSAGADGGRAPFGASAPMGSGAGIVRASEAGFAADGSIEALAGTGADGDADGGDLLHAGIGADGGEAERNRSAGDVADGLAGYIRPALTILDGFSLRADTPISWSHAFEALGAVFVSLLFLGVHYWPDSVEVVQFAALMKPLAYALASILVLVVSARGSVSSLASGGMDRLRRIVLICATPVLALSSLALPSATGGLGDFLRFLESFSVDTLLLFGLITSFIHLMRHGFSPTVACALLALLGCASVSLGIATFVLFDAAATVIGAAVAGIYGIALLILSGLERRRIVR